MSSLTIPYKSINPSVPWECLISYITHKDFGPSWSLSVTLRPAPWNLKWGGLESSGQRQIFLTGQTKRIAFFQIFFIQIFYNKGHFLRLFSNFLSWGLGWTRELWSNRVFLILEDKKKNLGNKFCFFKIFRLKKPKENRFSKIFWDFRIVWYFWHYLDFW